MWLSHVHVCMLAERARSVRVEQLNFYISRIMSATWPYQSILLISLIDALSNMSTCNCKTSYYKQHHSACRNNYINDVTEFFLITRLLFVTLDVISWWGPPQGSQTLNQDAHTVVFNFTGAPLSDMRGQYIYKTWRYHLSVWTGWFKVFHNLL